MCIILDSLLLSTELWRLRLFFSQWRLAILEFDSAFNVISFFITLYVCAIVFALVIYLYKSNISFLDLLN